MQQLLDTQQGKACVPVRNPLRPPVENGNSDRGRTSTRFQKGDPTMRQHISEFRGTATEMLRWLESWASA